ncbi:class I SAM-dependent DNA methyltransferase [Pseudohongiella spirulinae]|uniref:Methyltransferase domain-containing protein n=1 Tax=Pseudohongiella spirulinae TaxID=1249552 RepID=A0A0S2KCA7_9GAMM|nr:class I SAM-dependent methyltransferase [Pseudohongiella spirulinae]ALO45965.1 hypothetical protein PS2015_1307 [Pseudohongiella spirulinae]
MSETLVADNALYSDLSAYYDDFCAGVDYHEQSAFAHRVLSAFGSPDGAVALDLACGTGAHLARMQAYGYELHGLDLNPAMLKQAQVKVPRARLIESDMSALDVHEVYDLVSCFLYSIHYSHPVSSLRQTLTRVLQALKPGGVFVFNAVNAQGALTERPVVTQIKRGEQQLTFRSAWHYRGQGETLDLHLTITRQDSAGCEQWHDQHQMTAITIGELQSILSETGFEVTVLEHNYGAFIPWKGESDNVIFIACKPETAIPDAGQHPG